MATSSKRADNLWKRLIQIYGSRVAENYGPKPPEMWLEAIDDLSNEQINFGLRKISRESPIHPPALGQFVNACNELPVAETEKSATLQEQLSEYAMLKLYRGKQKLTPEEGRQAAGPWTYLFREWIDTEKPKYHQRQAECVGLVVEPVGALPGHRIMVVDMQADTLLHNKAVRRLSSGYEPRPNRS